MILSINGQDYHSQCCEAQLSLMNALQGDPEKETKIKEANIFMNRNSSFELVDTHGSPYKHGVLQRNASLQIKDPLV